jgi:hypothetical protein
MPLGRSRKTRWDLKLKWTHQLLVYADDVNLLGNNIDTIKKIIETLTEASKEVALNITKRTLIIHYCLITRMQGKIVTKRYLTYPLKMWPS